MKTIFLSLFCTTLFAGTIDPKTPDSKHVEYGQKFDCVGKITCKETETGRTAVASCVAIAPRWIITAAHVVRESKDFHVVFVGKTVPVVEVIVHENFDDHRVGCNDLALGHCESDLGLAFYPALYGNEDEVGKVASICGYGMTGTFSTGHTKSDSKRRAGSNVVDTVNPCGILICTAGGTRRTELEFCISPGDSGGGLFLGNELAGINSFVMAEKRSPMSRYGDESGHTRISIHKDWINERIK